MQKFLASAAAASIVVSMMATTAFAAVVTAPGQNKIQCFSGTTDGTTYGGTCTLQSNGAKGPAVLDNSSTNPNGDYSGVYLQNSTLTGQTLSSITQLGYMYSAVGTTTPMPGDLSLNLPISISGGTTTDAYAYVDAYYCPGTNGKVDVIHDTNCGIWFNGTEYPNWAAFVSAYPNATVSGLAFVVAERTPSEGPAIWNVNNVVLGKPGK